MSSEEKTPEPSQPQINFGGALGALRRALLSMPEIQVHLPTVYRRLAEASRSAQPATPDGAPEAEPSAPEEWEVKVWYLGCGCVRWTNADVLEFGMTECSCGALDPEIIGVEVRTIDEFRPI